MGYMDTTFRVVLVLLIITALLMRCSYCLIKEVVLNDRGTSRG